ncbi:MAG: hypothetical protein WA974_12890 [Thermodesulfobacteriota bacterium]
MTASGQKGEKLFKVFKIYMPQATDSRDCVMMLGPDKKLGLIRDTSIQPFAPKEETFEIPVPKGMEEVVVDINLSYQPRPENIYLNHSLQKKVVFH